MSPNLSHVLAILVLLTVPVQSVFRRPIVLPTSGPITHWNAAVLAADASATTIAAPATSLAAGNLIVVSVGWLTATSVSSIADTAGNTYVRIAGTQTANAGYLDLWYAQNTLGNASNVVTATFSAATNYRVITTAQYSGLKLTGALDVSATGTSAGSSSITSGVFTTTQADELLAAVVSSGLVGTWTPGSGYMSRVLGSSVMYMDKIVTSIQTSVTASATSTESQNKVIVVATFKGN